MDSCYRQNWRKLVFWSRRPRTTHKIIIHKRMKYILFVSGTWNSCKNVYSRTFVWLASGIDGDDEIVDEIAFCCKHCWLSLRQPFPAATCIVCSFGVRCLLLNWCCSLMVICDVDTIPFCRSAVWFECNEWASLPAAEPIVSNRSLVNFIGLVIADGWRCGRFASMIVCWHSSVCCSHNLICRFCRGEDKCFSMGFCMPST